MNNRRALLILAAAILLHTHLAGCSRKETPQASTSHRRAARAGTDRNASLDIELPRADQRLCTGVVILVDTSGSMANAVPGANGRMRPKHQIARDALERIVAYTQQWYEKHPDRVLQLGLIRFSSSASTVLPIQPFDRAAAESALNRLPQPGGGTAIGKAIIAAYQALYASGCVRKHILCITDGENMSGPTPDRVSRQLFAQTGGEVEMHFVAFDVSAESFAFLADVNGHVVQASNESQLDSSLSEVFEKNILAEAMPAERE